MTLVYHLLLTLVYYFIHIFYLTQTYQCYVLLLQVVFLNTFAILYKEMAYMCVCVCVCVCVAMVYLFIVCLPVLCLILHIV